MLCHAQKLCEAHLPPEPTRYAALGARASRSVPRARLISPSAACTQANAATSIWPPPCPSPASCRRAARARLYAACHGRFPAAEAASGLQFRISRVVGLVNQLANQAKKRENETRWQQKRNASVASHRSAPCGIALRGPFTPGTDEVCRTRRAPSRSVPRARLISPSAACTRANAATSIWPPPCPSPASRRPAPRARPYAACHGSFPAAEAALGCRELHLLCRCVKNNCQRVDDGQVEVAALGATCQRLRRAVVAVGAPGHEQRCQHVVGSRAGSDVPVLSVAASSCAAGQMGEEGM